MVLKLTDNNAYRSATFWKTHVATVKGSVLGQSLLMVHFPIIQLWGSDSPISIFFYENNMHSRPAGDMPRNFVAQFQQIDADQKAFARTQQDRRNHQMDEIHQSGFEILANSGSPPPTRTSSPPAASLARRSAASAPSVTK